MTNRTNPMTTADAKVELVARLDKRIEEHRAHLTSLETETWKVDERCAGIVLNFGDVIDLRAALEASPNSRTEAIDDPEDAAWAWLADYSVQRHGEEAEDVAFSADQMVDAFLAGTEALAMQAARPIDQQEAMLLRQLRDLAVVLHQKHYPEVAQWQPLDDALGILSQIDNMTTGLGRPSALPKYGEWLPDVWETYLRELVGWQDFNRWARLPATFRWHEFHERLASAIEAATAGETTKIGSTEGESAVGATSAETPIPGPIAPVQDDEPERASS